MRELQTNLHSAWTEEEARASLKKRFGRDPNPSEDGKVCEECFAKIMASGVVDMGDLEEFREADRGFTEALDEVIDKMAKEDVGQATFDALMLGTSVQVLGAKLVSVARWYKASNIVRPIDIYGMRSIADKLRRIADALSSTADRAEKERNS